MSEIVRHEAPSFDLQAQMDYSKALSAASIIPSDYRGKPANVLVAIGYAQALGEHPIAALTDIYVVNGRPSMSASMMHRRALEAGHRVRVEVTDQQATASIWRRDDPSHEHRVTWTMEGAQKAGLTKNPTWRSFPQAMLRSRAISECCRVACPEVLGAAKYTPDEIGGAFADAPQGEAPAPATATTKVSRRKRSEPVDAEVEPDESPAPEPAESTDQPAETGEAPTQGQTARMWAGLREHIAEDQHRAYMEEAVGHPIASSKDLTRAEVARIIDRLESTNA